MNFFLRESNRRQNNFCDMFQFTLNASNIDKDMALNTNLLCMTYKKMFSLIFYLSRQLRLLFTLVGFNF